MIRAAYISAAKGLGGAMERSGLFDLLARSQSKWALWVRSLPGIYDLEALIELGVPWWTFRAAEEVDRHLRSLNGHARVFEFGSGASTVWLGSRASEVHSVEHDVEFAEQLRPYLDPNVVHLHIVRAEVSERPAIPSSRRGEAGRDFDSYVRQIDQVDGSFDLVVVDGRAREHCLRLAIPHLKPGGLAVFDDAWRPHYRSALANPGMEVRKAYGLTPCLPYPSCTALIRAPAPAG